MKNYIYMSPWIFLAYTLVCCLMAWAVVEINDIWHRR